MTAADIKRSVHVGDVFDVTNHYIDRVDHPFFGTTRRTVVRVNPTAITFDVGDQTDVNGRTPWPKAADLSRDADGTIHLDGHPTTGAKFLTLVPVAGSVTLDT